MDVANVRGLLTGLASSVILAAGLAMMKSRAEALPPAQGTAILRAIVRWICDPTWTGGLILQTVGYTLSFIALAEAPVSLVSVMMQGGIAVFVVIAILFLHERANATEAAGIAGTIVAMVLLALSLHGTPPHGQLNSFVLGILTVLTLAGTAILCSANRLRCNGAAPAIAAGVAFGLNSLYTKALADIFATNTGYVIVVQTVVSPWFYLMIATNLAGLVLLQNSFHWARGIIAMPLSSAISNIVPIAGGIIAFDETMPHDPGAAALRIAAFVLTIVASMPLAGAEIPATTGDARRTAPVRRKF